MDKIPMQTLQVYKKPDRISSDKRFKKIEEDLRDIRVRFPMPASYRYPEQDVMEKKALKKLLEPKKIKSIELQNKLRIVESQLNICVNVYRDALSDICELTRQLPRRNHDINESDEMAQENVMKIARIEDIKQRLTEEFENFFIRHEENDERQKNLIRKLEKELGETQAIITDLEYELNRMNRLTNPKKK
jgi:hypothetical protein